MLTKQASISILKTAVAWGISPLRLSSQIVFEESIHRNILQDLPEIPAHRKYQLALIIRHLETAPKSPDEDPLRGILDAMILAWVAPELLPQKFQQSAILVDWLPDPDDSLSIEADLDMLRGSEALKALCAEYSELPICRWMRQGHTPAERAQVLKEITNLD